MARSSDQQPASKKVTPIIVVGAIAVLAGLAGLNILELSWRHPAGPCGQQLDCGGAGLTGLHQLG